MRALGFRATKATECELGSSITTLLLIQDGDAVLTHHG
jgi:hypothetical protein